MNAWRVPLDDIEDYLFSSLDLSPSERALYYHLLRHTWLVGKKEALFALGPLGKAAGMSITKAREDIRSMDKKGCIRIVERSRKGHRLRVLLPKELEGVIPAASSEERRHLEDVDFFTGRKYVDALLAREDRKCFYCLRTINAESCVLDHIVPQVEGGGNSYRNVVAACHECNSGKQGKPAEEFIRSVYRQGVLTQSELQERLEALQRTIGGKNEPEI